MSGIALKLTTLLIRTVAKPISNTIKAQAKEREGFRRGCISIAQRLHRMDVRLRMNLMGEKRIKVRPLNDNKAIEQGANFLSELFVFSVAGSMIFFESYRSRKKTTVRHTSVQEDLTAIQNELELLQQEVTALHQRVRESEAERDAVIKQTTTPPKTSSALATQPVNASSATPPTSGCK